MHTKVKMAGITVEKYDCITHPHQYAEQGGVGWGIWGCISQGITCTKSITRSRGYGGCIPQGDVSPNKNLLL